MARPVPAARRGGLSTCLQRMDYGREFRHDLGMDGKPDIPFATPLLDAVHLFDELGIRYAVIGGVAAMYYGRPRITEDIDFVAESGHEAKLAANPKAMEAHGFDPGCTPKLQHRGGIEIDIWKDELSDAIAGRAVGVTLGRENVRIAEVHDLIAMKLRAGRFQDDYDISEIVRASRVEPDELRRQVTGEQFARFEQIVARVRSGGAGG